MACNPHHNLERGGSQYFESGIPIDDHAQLLSLRASPLDTALRYAEEVCVTAGWFFPQVWILEQARGIAASDIAYA